MATKDMFASSPEADFYSSRKNGTVRCALCVKKCVIEPGKTGFCGVRYNSSGKLLSLVHGRVAAMHLAPSEIKPFFHFYPGALWLSLGTIGCNLKCPGCQNWHLAHSGADPALLSTEEMSPERIIDTAERSLCAGLSFTYNEPTVWLEFTREVAQAASKHGLLSTYVSNGMMSKKALRSLLGEIAAFRFDVKGFSRKTYEAVASPCDWEQVKKNAEIVARADIHIEIVTNVIPGRSDDTVELTRLANWICAKLGPDTPWHITRFHPNHKLSHVPPTPIETLERIQEIGKKAGLQFVYIGNVPGHSSESTYCPQCGKKLIERKGILITEVNLDGNRCAGCGREINIVGPPDPADVVGSSE